MKSVIAAIGTANPKFKLPQLQVTEFMAQALQLTPIEFRKLKALYKATGIKYRHSVLSDFGKKHGDYQFFSNNITAPFPTTEQRMKIYKQNALSLAVAAIKDCLKALPEFPLKEITHLITVSCTGMYAPGLDIEIVEKLQLNTHTQRTAINFMGCYGVFNALKVADAICKANTNAKVLIVSVELCSIHFQKSKSPNHLLSSAIFADGAGAALITANSKSLKSLILENFYCDLVPQSDREMTWEIADFGFDMILTSYVPELIKKGIAEFANKLLYQSGLNRDQITKYAIHPGGIKILQACENGFRISAQDNYHAYQVLQKFGNMSSATILFVLKEIWQNLMNSDHNQNIFSCAFGPGLTLESMLLKVHYV